MISPGPVTDALAAPVKRVRGLVGHTSGVRASQCSEISTWSATEDDLAHPELIPFGFDSALMRTRWAFGHVKWMVQKDALKQDMYLLGVHSPLRRWLIFRFCEMTEREVEYVALTRDTSEGDLKQRREIIGGGTVVWTDQSVVRAATKGRVLVIEGLEKVRRATRTAADSAELPPHLLRVASD